jgi:hypothetical protein
MNMNKLKQTYKVVGNQYENFSYQSDEYATRSRAREVFQSLGGAAAGYTLKQITTVVVEQKIR